MLKKNTIMTPQKGCLVEITEAVKEAVAASGLQEGVITVCTPDVDAGILITSTTPRVMRTSSTTLSASSPPVTTSTSREVSPRERPTVNPPWPASPWTSSSARGR